MVNPSGLQADHLAFYQTIIENPPEENHAPAA
jgi:hypothetical protein